MTFAVETEFVSVKNHGSDPFRCISAGNRFVPQQVPKKKKKYIGDVPDPDSACSYISILSVFDE